MRFGRSKGAATTATAEQARQRIQRGGVVVVDVRTAKEFAGGALEGSMHIDVNAGGFSGRLSELDPSADYLLYCGSGVRSAKALKAFHKAGIKNAMHIDGGISAWVEAGLPLARS